MTEIEALDRSIDIDGLCLDPRFGELNFAKSCLQLKKMYEVLLELEDLDYSAHLSRRELRSVVDAQRKLGELMEKIKSFSISTENASQLRDAIETQIDNYYNGNFVEEVRSSLIYLRQELSQDKSTTKELRQILKQSRALKEQLEEKLESIRVDQVSVESGSGIVSSEYLRKEFEDQCETHSRKAGHWMVVSIIMYTGLGVFLWLLFCSIQDFTTLHVQDSSTFPWQVLVFNLLSVATVFYAVQFCVRNYNIHRNLAVVNQHRRNVAATLTQFLEAMGDREELRTLLVKEASVALFTHKSTGYLKDSGTQISSPMNEIFAKVVTKN